MGITQLIDPFYKDLSGERFRDSPTAGQICWVASPQPDIVPQLLEIRRADAVEHNITSFAIRNIRETDFHRKDELPLYRLRLRLNEELIIQKAKRRPAIVLPTANSIFDDIASFLKTRGKKHLQQDSILVVPIFGIEKPDRPFGFPPIMTARIKALMYNQFFYCPRTPSGMAPIEGVARLDRIQVVFPVHRASYNPLPIKLSDDALSILMNLLKEWLRVNGTVEDETYLMDLKELLKETLPGADV
ncbi:MAG: hypothetical protein JRI80_13615 [Deltaproteobacteria bacterium]|nr:hypothetical protein [Deltaproteobacteria bacterium]MBW2095917.1 hypothetical protein [Deltaproteobacteria bacterium]